MGHFKLFENNLYHLIKFKINKENDGAHISLRS